jgi:hypothetical protein
MNRLLPELPGILNWAIAGWERLLARGYFVQPPSTTDAIEELEALGSSVALSLLLCGNAASSLLADRSPRATYSLRGANGAIPRASGKPAPSSPLDATCRRQWRASVRPGTGTKQGRRSEPSSTRA